MLPFMAPEHLSTKNNIYYIDTSFLLANILCVKIVKVYNHASLETQGQIVEWAGSSGEWKIMVEGEEKRGSPLGARNYCVIWVSMEIRVS